MDPFAESKPTLTAADLAATWTVSEGVELAVDLAGGCSAEEDAAGKPWCAAGRSLLLGPMCTPVTWRAR